jgi:N-acetylglutamate synthase-like GNAT family acetyltransferase
MIRRCDDQDFDLIWAIINDGAQAYRGTIPEDRWTEPYMSREKLQHEIDDGVVFWGYEDAGSLRGVMGLQQVRDVTLIRHAYVRTSSQKQGIGAHLLSHLRLLAKNPVLIGTWADAVWAIHFYERHGFQMVSTKEKERLLKQYWKIPERQIETSVVLADAKWRELSLNSSQISPLPAGNKGRVPHICPVLADVGFHRAGPAAFSTATDHLHPVQSAVEVRGIPHLPKPGRYGGAPVICYRQGEAGL